MSKAHVIDVSAYTLLLIGIEIVQISKSKNKNKRDFSKFLFLLFLHITDIFNRYKGKFYFVNLLLLH